MKPLPAPNVPGNTEWERFDNAMRTVLSVPKKETAKLQSGQKENKPSKE